MTDQHAPKNSGKENACSRDAGAILNLPGPQDYANGRAVNENHPKSEAVRGCAQISSREGGENDVKPADNADVSAVNGENNAQNAAAGGDDTSQAAASDGKADDHTGTARTMDNSESQDGNDADADTWGMSWNYWQGEDTNKNSAPDEQGGMMDAASPARQPDMEEAAEESDNAEKSMGLMDHLSELRQRVIRCAIAAAVGFGACWAFVDQLFDIIMRPLLLTLPEGTHAQYTTLPEAFFTRMEIAFVAGLFAASPFIFYQIWAFVAPGLYDEEKKHIIPIAFISALFFIGGGFFCYYIVFPFAFKFFVSFSSPEIMMTPKISDYLNMVLKLLFAFGLIFEMPVFSFFLARIGLLTAAKMRRARSYAIVAIFILAAILTPPDIYSQLLMACPMLLLYEASIGVAALAGRKRNKAGEETA